MAGFPGRDWKTQSARAPSDPLFLSHCPGRLEVTPTPGCRLEDRPSRYFSNTLNGLLLMGVYSGEALPIVQCASGPRLVLLRLGNRQAQSGIYARNVLFWKVEQRGEVFS